MNFQGNAFNPFSNIATEANPGVSSAPNQTQATQQVTNPGVTGYCQMPNFNGCCPNCCPTYQNCNQVVNRCFYEDVPHYINYHTHVVNNCIKRHYNVPTFSESQETVLINEQVASPQFMQGFNNGLFGIGNPFMF